MIILDADLKTAQKDAYHYARGIGFDEVVLMYDGIDLFVKVVKGDRYHVGMSPSLEKVREVIKVIKDEYFKE